MRTKPIAPGDSLPRHPWPGGIESLEPRALLAAHLPLIAPPAAGLSGSSATASLAVITYPQTIAALSPTDQASFDALTRAYRPRTEGWNAALGHSRNTITRSVHSRAKSHRAKPNDLRRDPHGLGHMAQSASPTSVTVAAATSSSTPASTSSYISTPSAANGVPIYYAPETHRTELLTEAENPVFTGESDTNAHTAHLANAISRPVLVPSNTLMFAAAPGALSHTLQLVTSQPSLFGPTSSSIDAFSFVSNPMAGSLSSAVRQVNHLKSWLTVLPQNGFHFNDLELFTNAATLMLSVTGILVAGGLTFQAVRSYRQSKAAAKTHGSSYGLLTLQSA